ncbi:MAG: hypothetical protein R3F19_28360 [Verrucomicrobiales bacterium]
MSRTSQMPCRSSQRSPASIARVREAGRSSGRAVSRAQHPEYERIQEGAIPHIEAVVSGGALDKVRRESSVRIPVGENFTAERAGIGGRHAR